MSTGEARGVVKEGTQGHRRREAQCNDNGGAAREMRSVAQKVGGGNSMGWVRGTDLTGMDMGNLDAQGRAPWTGFCMLEGPGAVLKHRPGVARAVYRDVKEVRERVVAAGASGWGCAAVAGRR
ncbi:hypothetical protein JB92DRAFT_2833847 [Gautieria morchelliformis]|nr:hypothetical protein JB92DRAFT_2833847 [Gautieria morchelliformis]